MFADNYIGRKLSQGTFTLLAIATQVSAAESLSLPEVQKIIDQGSTYAAGVNRNSVIAVVDREGFVLGVWDVANRAGGPSTGIIAGAVSRAGTAAALSSNENAFTSRTAGYIIQQHFPPSIRNTAPGPLVGVGFSNLFYSDTNRIKKITAGFNGATLAAGFQSPGVRTNAANDSNQVAFTSLADSPGGVPLYKNGELVGGVGVTGDGSPSDLSPAAAIFAGEIQANFTPGYKPGRDTDEEVALAAQSGFRPSNAILATKVLLNGIRIPYVFGTAKYPDPGTANPTGVAVTGYTVSASPTAYPYTPMTLGGVAGEVRQIIRDDPIIATPPVGGDTVGAANRLTAADVTGILTLAAQRCSITRAGIRLPLGTRAKTFISVVNNPAQDGVAPEVLGVFRVGEATMFSWDVCVQKARTAVFFSNEQMAMSCRAVGFMAQRYYPPGLDGRAYGPLYGFQEAVSLKTAPVTGTFPGNTNLPNGITIFPGGMPLYRNGKLVGAIGVSGDGVDQDDIVTASGCANFLPAKEIRADNFTYRGARLPYVKFPRNPSE